MELQRQIEASCLKLLQYMEKENFRGYDPYDGLESPLWELPLLNKTTRVQFLFQQFVKRVPLNIRPVLFINKGLNPVTIGLALQSYTELYLAFGNTTYLNKAKELVQQLLKLRSEGFSGDCWGYEFRWSSRYALIPAKQPTVVATGIITNALFIYWNTTNDEQAAEMIQGAARFVMNDLHRIKSVDDSFCFSYSPFDEEQVYNASMKGSRILAQANAVNPDENLKELCKLSVQWVINHQSKDGSWKYSESKTGTRRDNYHTGYILDCLFDCITLCNLNQFKTSLEHGRSYFLLNFFLENGQPKFYNDEVWPADCTSGGQAILSLLKMNHKIGAKNTTLWMIRNMQSEVGYFYFRKFRNYTVKTSFMRWSNAWMLAAMSSCLHQLKEVKKHA